MVPPSRKSCYNFRVTKINRVLDGDTIDVTIDLGFDLYKKERVRVAGVDTPEKRTRDKEEKELGLDATAWLKEKLDGAISGDDDLVIRTDLVGGVGKYGRLLGWLYIGDGELSLNEQMIAEGYAWSYDGGTKKKILKNSERLGEHMGHSFELTMEDYTIILNALHYYKKVEKRENFSHFDEERINKLRDKMAYQLIPSARSKP
ncbi:endonuclease [Synechococcus phage S-RIM2 R1_1999]|uniref:Endonuclease n=3 Tax=Nerrivikvirus srim2 TaxID=2734125 RepID=M4PY29_9CAUD|nr:endonuclease [Synechococcus phage S-RIM2 R1_1999]AGH07219.1 endonuclease [Synechococcus phage S-RIM2 R1_1999]